MDFEAACEVVRQRENDASFSESDKRLLYTFYKVATAGAEPTLPRPLNPVRAVYWDAWRAHGKKVSPEDAKRRYVAMVSRAVERMA